MVSIRKKKHQNKRLLCQFNESMNDSIFGNNTDAHVAGHETSVPQTQGLVSSFGRSTVVGNIANHNQVVERDIADRFRKEVGSAATSSP